MNDVPYIKLHNEVCEGCISGKQQKENFLSRTWEAKKCPTLCMNVCVV